MDQELIELYLNGLSLRKIQKETGIHYSAVFKILIKNNIPRRDRVEALALSKQNSFPINDYLLSVIEGELLGDGHVNQGHRQSCFSYGAAPQQYVNWLAKLFEENGVPLCGVGVYSSNTWDKRYGKYYKEYHFSTLHSLELRDIREKWYKNGIKILPASFSLNKTNLLHWWMGDGTLNKKSNYAWLITDNFSKLEVERLSLELEKLGINGNVRSCKKSSGHVFRIYIPRVEVLNLLDVVGKSPVECYKYKWKCRSI